MYQTARRILGKGKRNFRFQLNRFKRTGDIFDRIYSDAIWGGERGGVYSGNGSDGEAADAYVTTTLGFLKEIGARKVLDVGCGDFRIGSKIAAGVPSYIGVDVSQVVIRSNNLLYKKDGVSFAVVDAESDPLPSADVCLVRQVLQHLSNKSIKIILERLHTTYRYVLVTEHLPSKKSFRRANLDKPTGADIRVGYGSGVYVDQPPFDLAIDRILLEFPLTEAQSYKTTYSRSDPNSWEYLRTVVISGV